MKKSKSLTPAELVKKHIQDSSHVITDDELSNVVVGATGVDKEEFEHRVEQKEEELDTLKHHKGDTTPYDILDI